MLTAEQCSVRIKSAFLKGALGCMDTDNTVTKLHGHILLFCFGETLCGLLRQIMIKIFLQEETSYH